MKDLYKGENKMLDDQALDKLLQLDTVTAIPTNGRVERIVSTARQETGVRDLLTHMLLRVWVPIISIGSIFFVFLSKKQKFSTHSNNQTSEAKPDTDNSNTGK